MCLQVYYVLNKAPEGWTGGVGFVTAEMIQQHLPAPADDVMVLRCGPAPMNDAMAGHLNSIGYSPESLFVF
jgi:cytochrome-b5 reductase